ncbi:MAG: hypothetical protein QM662_08225 [Gordonia sp. (in: high G+C Gram-positive bacteria)]
MTRRLGEMAARWWQSPRNDASTLIGMQSPLALAVVGWYLLSCLLIALTPGGGVRSWPLFGVALLVVLVGAGALILGPGDPLRVPYTAVIVVGMPTLVVAGMFACVQPPSDAFGLIVGCVSVLAAFLCVRGRVVVSWLGFLVAIAATVAVGLARGNVGVWLGPYFGSVAVVLMSTLFAALIRPAAREVYALRAQTVREVAEEAATTAALAERDAQLVRLGGHARRLLERMAAGESLSAADRRDCRLIEARLRDGIRARALDTTELADAVWAARASGARITLLDDSGAELGDADQARALGDLRAQVVRLLRTADAGTSMTVRVHPPARDRLATIIAVQGENRRRIDVSRPQ